MRLQQQRDFSAKIACIKWPKVSLFALNSAQMEKLELLLREAIWGGKGQEEEQREPGEGFALGTAQPGLGMDVWGESQAFWERFEHFANKCTTTPPSCPVSITSAPQDVPITRRGHTVCADVCRYANCLINHHHLQL